VEPGIAAGSGEIKQMFSRTALAQETKTKTKTKQKKTNTIKKIFNDFF
jgi:hypothetical protein